MGSDFGYDTPPGFSGPVTIPGPNDPQHTYTDISGPDPNVPAYNKYTDPDYLAGANSYGFAQGLWNGTVQAGPGFIANQAQQQQDASQIAAQLASQTNQSGYLNTDYNLQMQGLGIDQAANARQPGFLGTLHADAGQQFDLQRQAAAASADQAQRALAAQLTARGAFTSVGGNQGRQDISGNLLRQTQGANVSQADETARYKENLAQVNDQAAKLGLTGEQYKNTLQQGLDRLNLSTATSVGQLLNQSSQTSVQDAVMRQNIINNAIGSSDYYSRLYPGPAPTSPSNPPPHPGGRRVGGGSLILR